MDKCKKDDNYIFRKNMQDFKVSFPTNGLFVGIQWVNINSNLIINKDIVYVGPCLNGYFKKSNKNITGISFTSGKWTDYMPSQEIYAEPLIEIELEN